MTRADLIDQIRLTLALAGDHLEPGYARVLRELAAALQAVSPAAGSRIDEEIDCLLKQAGGQSCDDILTRVRGSLGSLIQRRRREAMEVLGIVPGVTTFVRADGSITPLREEA